MPRLFKVTVNGREYEVAVLEITAGQATLAEQPAAAASSAGTLPAPLPVAAAVKQAPAAGSGDVVAGMGGVVMEVLVKAGQTVAAGDRLVIVEAMKMKTPIMATRAGQVTRVLVAAGEAVEAGQPLVTIA
jgi:biotin carboxyl carrier protein